MTIDFTITLSFALLSLSLIVQSFEMFSLCKTLDSNSPWSWNHVRNDFINCPSIILFSLDQVYKNNFKLLILLQIGLSLCLPVFPRFIIPLLIITYFLIALRFRGNFNGGSDAMTMATLVSLAFSLVELKTPIGFYLLAFHCTLSYFTAGIVKLKNKSWRSGSALQVFLTHSNYPVPAKVQKLAKQKIFISISSLLVIFFECTFPLVWLFPKFTGLYIILAIFFHIINYFCLGLNRFVFAWLASYPALFFCTQNA